MASGETSLPEITANAALIVDAYSMQSLSSGLMRMAGDEILRSDLRDRGFIQARRFTWEKTIRRVIDWIESNHHLA